MTVFIYVEHGTEHPIDRIEFSSGTKFTRIRGTYKKDDGKEAEFVTIVPKRSELELK